jgi:ribosome modulation factor
MSTTHENPYNPFENTDCYRAYQEGQEARGNGRPITTLPYPLSENRTALAWLDGWMTQARPSTRKDKRKMA